MKGRALVLFVSVFALVSGGQIFAQSQMTDSGTNYGSSTIKAVPIDKDHIVLIWEQMGLRVDDSGKGPFHRMATHLAMIIYIDKGVEQDHGYMTQSDKDGDKVIWEIGAFPIGSRTGKGKIIGATGKFEGMEGTMDYVLEPTPKSIPEDTGRTIAHEVIKYTLKKPLP
jgi:hypothetical protein